MEQRANTALIEHFSALENPRQQSKVLYPLAEIVLLLLCATLAGADDFVETHLWGQRNLGFLRRFLAYQHGVPSHDTLGEVIRVIDPDLFKACFTSWVEGLREDAPTSWRSTARRPGAATRDATGASHCTWCRPGRAASAWCWASRRWRVSRMRSWRSRCCSSVWP